MSDETVVQQELASVRQPDPLQRAADRIESIAANLVPRMTDIEKRQERQEGEMATQKDLSDFHSRLDEKLERFAHSIADDVDDKRKASDAVLKTEIKDLLDRRIQRFLTDELDEHVSGVNRKLFDERLKRVRGRALAITAVLSTITAIGAIVGEIAGWWNLGG